MPSSSTAASQASPFIIRVLEGRMSTRQLMAGVPLGEVWLAGRSLPYRPITFSGKQRTKTTWLPGNPVATQQVMGPTEEPTSINGIWKDRFLGNGVAGQLASLFQDIRRTGVLVEVAWGAGLMEGLPSGQPFVRQGVITSTEFTLDRPQDVQFKIEFTWRGDDKPVAPAVISMGVENPRQGFAKVAQSLQDMLDDVRGFQDSPLNSLVRLPGTIAAQLDSIGDQAEAMITALQDAVGLGTALAQLPSVAAERAIQVAGKSADLSRQMRDLLLTVSVLDMVPHDRALDILAFQGSQFEVVHSSDLALEQSINSQNALIGQVRPNIIGEVHPGQFTDLRDVARVFYGNPSLWGQIARFNGFEGSAIPPGPSGTDPTDDPGRPIFIPRKVEGPIAEDGC